MRGRTIRIALVVGSVAFFSGCALLSRRPAFEAAGGVPEMSKELLSKIDPEALAWFQEHPNEYRSLMFQWNIEEYPSAANNPRLRELEERLAKVSAPLGRYVEEHHARGTLSTKNPEYQRLLSESEKATDALSSERRKLMDGWQKRYDAMIEPLEQRVYAQLEKIEGVRVTVFGFGKYTGRYAEAKASALKAVASIPEIRRIALSPRTQPALNISSQVSGAQTVHTGPPPNYGEGVHVAVLDSGIHADADHIHPQMSPVNLGWAANFVTIPGPDDDSRWDAFNHGTAVAGVIKNFHSTYVSMASASDLVNAKCANQYGMGDLLWTKHAAEFAITEPEILAQVVNFSHAEANVPATGNTDYEEWLDWRLWQNQDVVWAQAAGNSIGPVKSPGGAFNCITVSMYNDERTVDIADDHWGGGSSGFADANMRKPDVCAPGVSTIVARVWYEDSNPASGNANDWSAQDGTGTSIAAPHVAGIAALLKRALGSATSGLVAKAILIHSADPPRELALHEDGFGVGYLSTSRRLGNWSPMFGWGEVNAKRAVDVAADYANLVREAGYTLGQLRAFHINDVPLSKQATVTLCWARHVGGTEANPLPYDESVFDLNVFDSASPAVMIARDVAGDPPDTKINVKKLTFSVLNGHTYTIYVSRRDTSNFTDPDTAILVSSHSLTNV